MPGLGDPATFALSVTNLGLGLVTLACLLAIARGVLRDLRDLRERRPPPDDRGSGHPLLDPELALMWPAASGA